MTQQKFDRTQLEYMLDHMGDYTERLTEWEKQFIESVSEQLEQRGILSEKQQEIVEKIYVRLP